MINTARLITSFKCNRHCPDCCNTQLDTMSSGKRITDLSELKSFKYICVTGGEPMLQPNRTEMVIRQLREQDTDHIIYMYTAFYHRKLEDIMHLIDGVQYTLHYPMKSTDLTLFYQFQNLIEQYNYQSFRLYIDSRFTDTVMIRPNLWKRVEVKAWQEYCLLPKNEKLFILRD